MCVFCFQREKRSGRKRKEDLLVSPGGLSQGGWISQPTCCLRSRGCNQSGKWSGTVRSPSLFPSLPQTSVPIRIFRPQFSDSRAFCFSRHPFRSLPPLYPVMKEQPFSAANLLRSQSARPTRYEVPSTHQSGGSGCVETKQIIG